jgi:hypothetical protein
VKDVINIVYNAKTKEENVPFVNTDTTLPEQFAIQEETIALNGVLMENAQIVLGV